MIAELTAIHLQETSPRFLHQRLYDGEYVVVMRRHHPLARKPLTLDAYCAARHLLVSFSGRPFGFVDEALSAMSRQRRVVITVNQFFTAGRVVASTDLLTVLPRHFVEVTGIESELTLRELPLPVPPVHVDALWHRQSAHSSAHRWLRQAVERAGPARLRRADTDNRCMKLQLLSDLHLEADPGFVATPAPEADLLVLAGDVGSYQTRRDGSVMAEPDWGLQRFSPLPQYAGWPAPVLFVPGNHEYDGLDMDEAHTGSATRL